MKEEKYNFSVSYNLNSGFNAAEIHILGKSSHVAVTKLLSTTFTFIPIPCLPACSSSPAARCRVLVSQTGVGCTVTGTICCIWKLHLIIVSLRVRGQSELQIAPTSWLAGCISPHFLAVIKCRCSSFSFLLSFRHCMRSEVIRVTILPMSLKLSVCVNALEDNTCNWAHLSVRRHFHPVVKSRRSYKGRCSGGSVLQSTGTDRYVHTSPHMCLFAQHI